MKINKSINDQMRDVTSANSNYFCHLTQEHQAFHSTDSSQTVSPLT